MRLKTFSQILLIHFLVLGSLWAQEGEDKAKDSVYNCSSDVFFHWERTSKSSNSESGESSKAKVEKEETPEIIEEFYKTVKAEGDNEEAAKTMLAKEVLLTKRMARSACREAHENFAGCISTKLVSMSTVIPRVSFSARKQLEQAIEEDCRAKLGTCKAEKSSEPKCDGPPSDEQGDEAEAGDKKKKKK